MDIACAHTQIKNITAPSLFLLTYQTLLLRATIKQIGIMDSGLLSPKRASRDEAVRRVSTTYRHTRTNRPINHAPNLSTPIPHTLSFQEAFACDAPAPKKSREVRERRASSTYAQTHSTHTHTHKHSPAHPHTTHHLQYHRHAC